MLVARCIYLQTEGFTEPVFSLIIGFKAVRISADIKCLETVSTLFHHTEHQGVSSAVFCTKQYANWSLA